MPTMERKRSVGEYSFPASFHTFSQRYFLKRRKEDAQVTTHWSQTRSQWHDYRELWKHSLTCSAYLLTGNFGHFSPRTFAKGREGEGERQKWVEGEPPPSTPNRPGFESIPPTVRTYMKKIRWEGNHIFPQIKLIHTWQLNSLQQQLYASNEGMKNKTLLTSFSVFFFVFRARFVSFTTKLVDQEEEEEEGILPWLRLVWITIVSVLQQSWKLVRLIPQFNVFPSFPSWQDSLFRSTIDWTPWCWD